MATLYSSSQERPVKSIASDIEKNVTESYMKSFQASINAITQTVSRDLSAIKAMKWK